MFSLTGGFDFYQAVKSGTFGTRFAVVTNITTEAVSNQNPRRNKTGGTLVANDGKSKEAMCFMYSKIYRIWWLVFM